MGCFRACFGHLRNTEKCLSPSNESVKLIPENTESLKEEDFVNPHKLISQLTEDIKLGENEMEGEKEKEDSLKKEYLPKESSSQSLQQESCCSSLFTLSIDSSKQFLQHKKSQGVLVRAEEEKTMRWKSKASRADINKLNGVVSSTTTSCCSGDDQTGSFRNC
ncbi:hypothetical protein AAHA92_09807 [Salvia divinorum]|uniref:Uncharacterized protein n=1 Tax=Salvia divinorum TaxID=28513 RepID=A0ABD1HSJ7_SALDI